LRHSVQQQSRRRATTSGFAFVPKPCRPTQHRLGCRTGGIPPTHGPTLRAYRWAMPSSVGDPTPKTKRCEYGRAFESRTRIDNVMCRYLTLRLAADCLPRLLSISYSMVCPSLSERSPARSTAEI